MNGYTKKIELIIVCFLLIFLILPIISANLDLTPKVEVCQNGASKCYNENIDEISEQDSLLLKITLANSDYEIACLDEPKLTYFFYKDSAGQTDQDKVDSKEEIDLPKILCLPKGEKVSYFQVLEKYSNSEPKERKNKWIVEEVKLDFKTSECYDNLDYYAKPANKCFSSNNNYFTGDKKIEVNVSGKASSISWFSGFRSLFKIISAIIGAILLGIDIDLWIKVYHRRNNKKPWFGAICITIILIILGGWGFTN